MIRIAALAIVIAGALGDAGCGCTGGKVARPYPEPTAAALLTYLRDAQTAAQSFRAESVMDYWVGGDRVKGTVLLMGRIGAYMRINALNPTGDNVAADLACNGDRFAYIDYNKNCQLSGPCDQSSVARLLRVSLHPDDFLLLAVGLTPVLRDATATLRWDPKHGHEVLTLTSPEGFTQTIKLRPAELPSGRHFDVVSSVAFTPDGKKLWSLANKDFTTIRGEGGRDFRVPEKTQFKQPQEKADLLVRWKERSLNPALDDAKFEMSIPEGLPGC